MSEAAPTQPAVTAEQTEATEPEETIYDRVLGGEFENVPPTARKLVRIFTSSTFTGLVL